MEQRDNIKYILLDVWGTLLLSNIREKNINKLKSDPIKEEKEKNIWNNLHFTISITMR